MNPLSFIPSAWMIYVRAAVYVALAGICFGGGWMVNGWRLGTANEKLVAQDAQEHAQALTVSIAATKAAQARADTLQAQLSGISATGYAALRKGEHENDNLRSDVATGARVVRFNGLACPAANNLPKTAASGSVDSGAGAAVDAATGQAVLSLRASAERIGVKLQTCQAQLGCITGQSACAASSP